MSDCHTNKLSIFSQQSKTRETKSDAGDRKKTEQTKNNTKKNDNREQNCI